MQAKDINPEFNHDLASRVIEGSGVVGTTTNDPVSIFGTIINISKHAAVSVAIINTDAANGLTYSVEVTDNPTDEIPVWAVLATDTLAAAGSVVLEKQAVGRGMRITVESTVDDTHATFNVFYRLNPTMW